MKIFKAGPIVAGYENGFLRRISYGQVEILRMIYFALRDHNWNTVGGRIENERISAGDCDFQVTYDCRNVAGDVPVMEWKAAISGAADGTIVFEIRGAVTENFRRNRAGFCVLHPLNIAGVPCTITHPDGTTSTSPFPEDVDPENPFRNIEGMTWTAGGALYSLTFEGDLFETEDQRNWSDASFKTFCTPLYKPFPVELKKGDHVFQRITFRPKQKLGEIKKRPSFISLRQTGIHSTLPSLGIAASTQTDVLSAKAVSLIRALNLRQYRVEVSPENENWVSFFSRAYENGYALNLPLEVALHLGSAFIEEMESFIVLCLQNKVKLRKILLLPNHGMVTGQQMIDQAGRLKESFPNVLIGAGTNYNFNEINKNRFSPGELDFISFSVDPQEHATDDLTILENAETQEHLVKSARTIYGHSSRIHVSPVTLKKRFNPYATNPKDVIIEESLKADARQKEIFAAVWTFASICSLARGGADNATYYQTVGDQGILSKDGEPYPVYHIFKSFAACQKKAVEIIESSEPLAVQGILLDNHIIAVANLSDEEKEVRMDNRGFILRSQEIKFMDLNRA